MSEIKLPEGWVEAELQEVAVWGSGGTPSRKYPEYYNGDIPWIKTGDLGPRLITRSSEYITKQAVQNSNAKLFSKNSVVIAMYGATIGKTSILGIDATTNQACAVGLPIENVTTSIFLYYLLLNEKKSFIAKSKGGAQPNISQAIIKEHKVPFPPLAEQKIITDKLDSLLAQVDNTKTRLEQIPQILKRFRQAVLASAVSGRLTPKDQKSNVQFDVSVGSLCITSFDGPFGSKLKTDDYTNAGVRVARLENIGHLTFNDEKETYISDTKFNSLKGNKIEKDDVLFSSFVDEDVRVCLFPHNDKIFINKADCFCLRINQEIASPKYVALTLASRTSYEQIKAQVQGVTRPRINLKTLRSLSFTFPSLQEQNEIVRCVEQLFAYADGIEKQVQNALECVNNLTQSILAKAFRGELTAQWRVENPDLISGENSAQALLVKIQQQRSSIKTIKRGKGNS
ncbi:type I restriction endonuclease subunit S [Lelliottia aquatilis]|uniref:restriction endonuclease subunit S n=1 Tax=Lelliottia aquatilis TaxID=2080838 RepID=UPI00157721B2|nr:type I restriction endonuclease subunit S [Lelliottia aquatilis]